MYHNGGVHNCIEWIGSIPNPFSAGDVAPKNTILECKVCRSMAMCIALYHARTIYVHSTSLGMSKACIHQGVHEHPIWNGKCRKLLDTTYQCIANEIMKTPTTKNFAIFMAVKKKSL